jgi:hypothetical protein
MAYREDLLARRVHAGTGTKNLARVRHGVIWDSPSEAPQSYVPLEATLSVPDCEPVEKRDEESEYSTK